MKRVAALLAALTVGVLSPQARAASVTTLFTLADKRLDEVSGIARGIVSPDVYYVQNDSGDSARFFALDARTGRVRAVYHVPGATNVDWEDLAVARDAAGTPSVWIADIGDNGANRDEIELYRVPEPRVRDSARPIATARPQVWHLRYPGGPVDAESIAVTPHGRAFVVTKVASGDSTVYAVPRRPGGVQTMRAIAHLHLTATRGSLIPAGLQRLATGAAISANGTLLAIRTYTAAYVWTLHGGAIAAALRAVPRRITLPLQPQGEGVCIVGGRLVLSSEQVGSPVYSVPIDAAATVRSPPSSSLPPASAGSTNAPSTAVVFHPAPAAGSKHASDVPVVVVIATTVPVLAVLVVGVARRRRRPGRHGMMQP